MSAIGVAAQKMASLGGKKYLHEFLMFGCGCYSSTVSLEQHQPAQCQLARSAFGPGSVALWL